MQGEVVLGLVVLNDVVEDLVVRRLLEEQSSFRASAGVERVGEMVALQDVVVGVNRV